MSLPLPEPRRTPTTRFLVFCKKKKKEKRNEKEKRTKRNEKKKKEEYERTVCLF